MAASALAGGIGTATAADVAPYYRAPPVVVPLLQLERLLCRRKRRRRVVEQRRAVEPASGVGRIRNFSRSPAIPAAPRPSAASRPATIGNSPPPGSSASKATGPGPRPAAASMQPWVNNPGGGASARLVHQHEFDAGLGVVASRPARLPRDAEPDGLRHGGRRLGQDRLHREQQQRKGGGPHTPTRRPSHSPTPRAVGWRAAASNG